MSAEFASASEPIRSWREEDGVIYFSVVSDGTSGVDWITRLQRKDFRLNEETKQVLRSSSFVPTSYVTTQVAIFKGVLFEDSNRTKRKRDKRTMKNIRAEAARRRYLTKPNAELACLICDKFTNEDFEVMGLNKIFSMHKPLVDSEGCLRLLVNTYHKGFSRWLNANYVNEDDDRLQKQDRNSGFAFAVSTSPLSILSRWGLKSF